jgi:hypothetical protein
MVLELMRALSLLKDDGVVKTRDRGGNVILIYTTMNLVELPSDAIFRR